MTKRRSQTLYFILHNFNIIKSQTTIQTERENYYEVIFCSFPIPLINSLYHNTIIVYLVHREFLEIFETESLVEVF